MVNKDTFVIYLSLFVWHIHKGSKHSDVLKKQKHNLYIHFISAFFFFFLKQQYYNSLKTKTECWQTHS